MTEEQQLREEFDKLYIHKVSDVKSIDWTGFTNKTLELLKERKAIVDFYNVYEKDGRIHYTIKRGAIHRIKEVVGFNFGRFKTRLPRKLKKALKKQKIIFRINSPGGMI